MENFTVHVYIKRYLVQFLKAEIFSIFLYIYFTFMVNNA